MIIKSVSGLALIVLAAGCFTRDTTAFKTDEARELYKEATALQMSGDLVKAIERLDKADSLSPNSAVIIHERGLVKSNLKRFPEAIADINRSIELTTDPKQRSIRMENRGLVLMEMGDTAKACMDFKALGSSGNAKHYAEKYCK